MGILQQRFIANVNAVLNDAGISRAELARRMGVSQPIPGQYLNAEISPGFQVVEKFAAALGLPDPGILVHEDIEHVLRVFRKHVQPGQKAAVAS